MTKTVLSVRVSSKVGKDLERFIDEEHLAQTSEGARKLLLIGLQKWKCEKALQKLAEGRLSFMKAAELSEMDVWDFADVVKERSGIWVKTKPEKIAAEIKEALR